MFMKPTISFTHISWRFRLLQERRMKGDEIYRQISKNVPIENIFIHEAQPTT